MKSKLILIVFTIGAFFPSVILGHPGHGNAESNYFHYMIDYAADHYVWLLLLVFFLIILRVSARSK